MRNKQNLFYLILVVSLLVNFLVFFEIGKKINFSTLFQKKETVKSVSQNTGDNVFDEINPKEGYEINVSFDALGPKMIESGVIDFEKFKIAYENSGSKLSAEQIEILQNGSSKKIKIDNSNAYFLLNFFWAVGLNNNSRVLSDGEMSTYGGGGQADKFASTGGWSLSKTTPMDYYSNNNLISLTREQENLVASVASRIYRPCCDNSTAFPDCNHGMAMLGILELMGASGATESQMFEAAKYFNAFWFPGNYYDLAIYFKNKTGESFKEISGEKILSKNYSSLSGYQTAKSWLAEKGLVKQPPKQGGSCGV